ncbi:CPBP family intramembrane glutamic endopeptidase [Haloferax sp. DFSO52]|uniref:CPBP family intramembrane glutamic endopeptidase n=1 Tax=Haloferax sp. DFSO52 TaxID=3388505 RepID=UPI003A844284
MSVDTSSTRSRISAGFGTVPYFVAAGLLIFVGIYVATPWLVARRVPLLFAITGSLFLPIVVVFAAALVVYQRGGGDWRWPAFRDRFRLQWPTRREWLLFLTAGLLVLAVEALLEPVSVWVATIVPLPLPAVLPPLLDPLTPVDVPPSAFMGMPLAGNLWIVPFWILAFVVNIAGEELLWRGYLLPRQEAVFGRWAWLLNGILWAYVVHAFMWWNFVTLLPTSLVTPYLAQRYETTWAGITVHGLGNAIWVVVLAASVIQG